MRFDAVVVGGGVIGLASAWRLAQRGLPVAVVDARPGSGASGVAAGMLAPVTEARLGEEELLQLGMASLDRWPTFAAEVEDASGLSIGYRTDGTIVVGLDRDDRAALVDLLDRQRALGLDVDDLSARELRDLEPGLAPGVRRGGRAAAERAVDPQALVAALVVAAERAGVTFVRQRVVELLVAPGPAGTSATGGVRASGSRDPATGGGGVPPGERPRAHGVSLADGSTIHAGRVVLAAGAWSGQIDGLPPAARPPVRPVKGQVVTLRTRPGDAVVRHVVRAYVRGSVVYLVPRDDGRVVVGATAEERGWDSVPTAGAAYELLRDVLALFPGLDDAELVGTAVGFRPGTPDSLPRLGPSPDVDGLVLATGHYRNGILLTPLSADTVAAAVTGEVAAGAVGA